MFIKNIHAHCKWNHCEYGEFQNHTLNLWKEHEQYSKQVKHGDSAYGKYQILKGIGIGGVIMAWLVIGLHALFTFVIGK